MRRSVHYLLLGSLGLLIFVGALLISNGLVFENFMTETSLGQFIGSFFGSVFYAPVCGDGILDVSLGEECDDGGTVSGDGCGFNCLIETCGDGRINLDGTNIIFGDDWPLYDPGRGRGLPEFQSSLDNIFDLWDSTGRKFDVSLIVHDNELEATNPSSSSFNQSVNATLASFLESVDIPPHDLLFYEWHPRFPASIFTDHPLVDSVAISVVWNETEPQRGNFYFDSLDENIDTTYNSGKKVMLRIVPYGKESDDSFTPSWIYSTVPNLTWYDPKVGNVLVPVVWNDSFYEVYEEYIHALAVKYNNDSRVDSVRIGIGHLGFDTASLDLDAQVPFENAGWTVPVWEEYTKKIVNLYENEFTNRSLYLAITTGYLRNSSAPSPRFYETLNSRRNVSEYAAGRGVSLVFKGVEPDISDFESYGLPAIYRNLTLVDFDEECDDGNLFDDDGCSHLCTLESGMSCETGADTSPYGDCDGCVEQNEIESYLGAFIEGFVGMRPLSNAIGSFLSGCSVSLFCVTANSTWQNSAFTEQTGSFRVEFNATPSQVPIDGVIALSSGAGSIFDDYAIMIRFNNVSGTDYIDVRNSNVYAADTIVAYQAGVNYRFRVDIDVPSHRYNVRVTPDGGSETVIATNYLFREQQQAVTNLNSWGVWSVDNSMLEVCDFTVVGSIPPLIETNCTDEIDNDSDGQTDCADGDCMGVGDCTSPVFTSSLTPIARWDTVPRQRINSAEALNVGVVAFSKNGIKNVTFAISGAGYTGGIKTATQMTLNPQTGVWEYWTPISASEFGSDGQIAVSATVYGNDGGVRNSAMGEGLEQLSLVVNPHGSLPHYEAWVAVSGGSDGSCVVDNPSLPCATIGRAMSIIANAYGGNADGGVVKLLPGTHVMNNGCGWSCRYLDYTLNEWVTIESDSGNREDTVIESNSNDVHILSTKWLKVKDLTLRTVANNRPIFNLGGSDPYSPYIWIDDCNITGSDRYDLLPHPVGNNYRYKYFTNSYLYNLRNALGEGEDGYTAELARNLTIEHIGHDAMSATPMIVNVVLRDQDPGAFDQYYNWHADVWQSNGVTTAGEPPTNWIAYNVHATDLHYQGVFWRDKALGKNNAIVNAFVELRDPVRCQSGDSFCGGTSWIGGLYDHLLIWNSDFIGTNFEQETWFANDAYTGTPLFRFSNSSFVGNLFTNWKTTEGISWTQASDVEFRDNHFVVSSGALTYTPGMNYTTGTPQINTTITSSDFGKPLSGSPLVGRVATLVVPIDVYGNLRGSTADVGALELN